MKQLILAFGLTIAAVPAWSNGAATSVVNQIRADQGLPKISYSRKLEKAAQRHLSDMVQNDFRSHTGSNGSSVGKRVKRAGYRWCHVAENIAWGQRDLQSVMQGWVNSPGHYRNLTSRKAREFALVKGGDNVWVMVLAAKRC